MEHPDGFTVIREVGGSYYILLPKKLYEFYSWNKDTILSIEYNSEQIIIKKVNQVDEEYKKRAGIPFDEEINDKDRAIEKGN